MEIKNCLGDPKLLNGSLHVDVLIYIYCIYTIMTRDTKLCFAREKINL